MCNALSAIYCFLLTVVIVADAARILAVLPTPCISHQIAFRPIPLELAKRGHEVFVITTDPIFTKGKAPTNYTEIDIHDISYGSWGKLVKISDGQANNLAVHTKTALELFILNFERQMQATEVLNILQGKAQKFDLLFVESCVRPALAISHILKIPTIQFSSLGALPGMYEAVGAPTHILLYPLQYRQKILNLSFWKNIADHYSYYLVHKVYCDQEEVDHRELNRIFTSDIPAIKQLMYNIDLTFLNTNRQWNFNRPIPNNVLLLGNLNEKSQETLPKELKSYLDSSLNGIVYMSLGTNVKPSSLPRATVKLFLKVFASLPYNIICKWDQDELEGKPNNVKIYKWLPQFDLLHHPNIKLFITQGGQQSTDESITAGVPLIGIPMLGDQWFNTEMYVLHKIGVKLDVETLTEDDFRNAINTVLKDDLYRQNIVRFRNLIQDQPQTSLERAIWWTEYVLRHGGAQHLRSPAANITWTEYLELELVTVVLIVLLVFILILVLVLKLVFKSIFSYFKLQTKNKMSKEN